MNLSLIHRVAQILRHPCGLGREFGILHRNGTSNYPRDSPVCGARQTIDRIYQIMKTFRHLGCLLLFISATRLPDAVAAGGDKTSATETRLVASTLTSNAPNSPAYFPPPESQGGWRRLDQPQDIRRLGGMDPEKLGALREWLMKSDGRPFAADVIRHGYIVLEVERGNSAKTDSRRVASVSKAICATVLAIASERSQHGLTPKKMSFDDLAFPFIPWAYPLSDPRKAGITVKQLLNHTSGICPGQRVRPTKARGSIFWD